MTRLNPSSDPRVQLADHMKRAKLELEDPAMTIDQLDADQVQAMLSPLRHILDSRTIPLDKGRRMLQLDPPKGLAYRVISGVVLQDVQEEATRAHLSHGDQSMFGDAGRERRLSIVTEEYGEALEEMDALISLFFQVKAGEALGRVAHQLTYDAVADRLYKELTQFTAMGASWMQALRNEARNNGG